MEEKSKDTAAQPSASSAAGTPPKSSEMAATAELPSSRRRGQKRKANNSNSGNTSNPQTASSKRQAREKPPAIPFPPIHNGPWTRARQSPAAAAASASVGASLDAVGKSEAEAAVLPENYGGEVLEALETKVEAEYEAIRSRDANAHVIPIPCGWFSWTKVHPLEERTLLSFFNGKSESRTPEIYMEMRNWIMKKFHSNPNMQIELKDLSELSVGELDARQEVMEFLDYWGLINYHPLLDTDSATDNADEAVAIKSAKTDSLLENLYRFEVEKSYVSVVPRPNAATPAVPSGLFPESAITEEARPEGPSVEYHCNSCSADCSRKRYHCQKQADFDLCSECFINGKFGSNMSPSDFILMEPAEAPGVSGGKWTDQETLLLLEALELYKENWNEIAEHVATKTKAQCILHFVQMPIEDTFLECDDEFYASVKGNSDPVSTPKDAHETTETKTGANENQPLLSPVKTSKQEDADELKVGENCALKALEEAFEAVGSLPKPGEKLSFSEAGNPVMALAAFLVHMVDPNVATASVHNSLKSIAGMSSGTHLAARHCFLLEDPPDEKKKSTDTDRALTETDGRCAQKDENPNDETQKEEKSNSVLDGSDLANDRNNEKNKDSVEEEKENLVSPNSECTDKPQSANEADIITTHEEGRPGILNESDNPDLPNDQAPMEESDSLISSAELPVKDSKETSVEEPSQCTEAPKDEEMVPDSLPLEKKEPEHPVTSNMVDSGANTGVEEATDSKTINEDPSETKSDLSVDKLKRAAVTAISAAAVKAKLLANQEEDQIRQLASLLVEKQLHKLENKLVFFNEMESVVMRVREQMERSRQRLYHERAQIIAARLGLPASSSRPMQQSSATNRVAMSFANSAPKPPMSMTSQRPPITRPMMASLPPTSNPFVPATVTGNSVRPSNQDKLSSVGTK